MLLLRIFTFLVLVGANTATAQPGIATITLMQRSPNLLDWGILKLENYMVRKNAAFDSRYGDFHVSHDPQSDQILIRSFGSSNDEKLASSIDDAYGVCGEWFKSVRALFGMVYEDGPSLDNSLFAHTFYSPTGIVHPGGMDTDKMLELLDKQIFLEYTFRIHSVTEPEKRIYAVCKGAAAQNGFDFRTM